MKKLNFLCPRCGENCSYYAGQVWICRHCYAVWMWESLEKYGKAWNSWKEERKDFQPNPSRRFA